MEETSDSGKMHSIQQAEVSQCSLLQKKQTFELKFLLLLTVASPAMYQQPEVSPSHIEANNGASGSRAPPMLDDFGFDKLSIGQSRPPTNGSSTSRPNSKSIERVNTAYANQEIYQSAAEVQPENSLKAISDEVDQAAIDIYQGHSGQGLTDESGRMIAGTANNNYDQYNPAQQQQGGNYDPGMYSQGAAGASQGWYGQDGQYYDDQQQAQQYAGQSAYNQPYLAHQGAGYPAMAPSPPQMPHYDAAGNPYMAAAAGFGLEYPGAQQYPAYDMGGVAAPSSMAPLHRQTTQMSTASAHSTSSANARRKSKDDAAKAVQQKLPFNKAFVEEYRHRMKGDPDAEAQFAFARYLIEAAKKVQDPKDGPKQARKYRDNLLGESLKLIKRLATTGMGLGKPPYSEAQFFLANCFGNGSLGLQVDHEKAYNLYVQASKQNHAAATYRTAVCNEVGAGTRRDHHRAVLFYRKASALGDTAGMYKLGMILLNGLLGQMRNPREAIVWLKRAAGQADEDNPHALHELGLLHEKPTNSSVVPHDEAHARELFTQAAQLGYAPSQFKLGSAYEYGSLTCPVDPRRSIAWYTKAAGKNDGESELALSGWYLTGSEGVLKQSDSEAYLWARRAATKGIPKAEYAVGYYSEVGIGVAADIEEAKRWYMRAAAQGNKRAMMRLTELKQQKGVKVAKKGARPTRKDAETECVIV
jgi:TPR repeat protein